MRFFFDTYNGKDSIRDREGRELSDESAARWEAIEDAKELIGVAIDRAEIVELCEIRVREGCDRDPSFTLPFQAVIAGLRS